MSLRFIHLFILAAMAWLAPLTALHHQPQILDPSLTAPQTALDVAVTCSRSGELPSMLEEERPEEERPSDVDRQPVAPASGTTPTVSSWCAAPRTLCAAPVDSLVVSCAAPRGPPASWL